MASDPHPYNEQHRSLLRNITLSAGDYDATLASSREKVESRTFITAQETPSLSEESASSLKSSHRHWTRIWLFELIAIVVSIGSLLASIAILFAYDGQPLSQWKAWMRPNTVVAALNTASTTTMLMVIGCGLGQLKWVYFRQRPQALMDLQVFDEASRGPLGSVRLLYRVRWRAIMACVGSLLTILTLATESFVQQVLEYPQRQINATGLVSTIAKSTAYDTTYGSNAYIYLNGIGYDTAFGFITNSKYDDAILSAIAQGAFGKGIPIDVNCVSGNCTWDPFESLAVCSSCVDVTKETILRSTCSDWSSMLAITLNGEYARNCTHTTPSNISVTSTNLCGNNVYGLRDVERGLYGTLWNASVQSNGMQRGLFVHYDNMPHHATLSQDGEIAKLAAVQMPDWEPIELDQCTSDRPSIKSAYECSLKWCVNAFDQSRVINGSAVDISSRSSPLTFMDWTSCNGMQLSPWKTFLMTQGPYENFTEGVPSVFEAGAQLASMVNIVPAFLEVDVPDVNCDTLTIEDVYLNEDCAGGDYSACNNTKLGDRLRAAPGAYLLNAMNSIELGGYIKDALTTSTQRGELLKLADADATMFLQEFLGSDDHPASAVAGVGDMLADVLYEAQRAGRFPETMDNIAASITNHIRNGPNSTMAHGSVQLMETYIAVHWPWMVLPAVLVVTSTAFLAFCILVAQESNVPVWKESVLPMLFHGIRGWHDSELDVLSSEAITERSERMLAQLREDKLGQLWLMRADKVASDQPPTL